MNQKVPLPLPLAPPFMAHVSLLAHVAEPSHPAMRQSCPAGPQNLRSTASTTLIHHTGLWISSTFTPLVGRVVQPAHNHLLVRGLTKLRPFAHCHRFLFVKPTLFIYRAYRRRIVSQQYHLLPDDVMEDNNDVTSTADPSIIESCPSENEKGWPNNTPSATVNRIRRRRFLIWSGIGIGIAIILSLGRFFLVPITKQ